MSFEKMTFNQVSLNMKPFVEMPSFDVKRLDVASFDEILLKITSFDKTSFHEMSFDDKSLERNLMSQFVRLDKNALCILNFSLLRLSLY